MRYRKDQMGSLPHKDKTLTCSMGFEWPPIEVVAYGSPEEAREHISDTEMQRIGVWEKLCGLRKMEPTKCLSCKFVLLEGEHLNQTSQGRKGISQRVPSRKFSPHNKHTPPKR